MSFCELLQIEMHGGVEGSLLPLGIINTLCESGKAGRFVHYVESKSSQWDKLCALEDALVDGRKESDFVFIVGSMTDDPEVRGWLEYGDVIIVPYGPKGQQRGSDVGVWAREVFDEITDVVHAVTPCAADSAIHINQTLRDLHGKPIGWDGSVG